MGRLLVGRETRVAVLAKDRLDRALELTDLQHVHVVVVAGTRVGAQVEVLADEVLDRLPVRTDVLRRAPRLGDVGRPRAGERPAAEVEAHVRASRRLDGVGDLGVAVLLV